jgi:hypothetical protein
MVPEDEFKLQYMVVKSNHFRQCLSSGVDILDEVLEISNREARGYF